MRHRRGIALLFQPGTEWNCSVATDVLGRVIEVVSGQPLDDFLAARILRPLGMTDTGFHAGPSPAAPAGGPVHARAGGAAARLDALGGAAHRAPAMLGGGGGLVWTAADYHRFTQMLLHRADSPAGELDGMRLLSPRTVGYMTRNHLPGGADLETFGGPLFAESRSAGSASDSAWPSSSIPGRQGALFRGRAVVGRRGQHHLLDRPGRRADRLVLHPASPSSAYPIRPSCASSCTRP